MRLHVDADFRSLTKQISMCQLFSRKVTCRKVYVLSLIDNGLDDVSWRFFCSEEELVVTGSSLVNQW